MRDRIRLFKSELYQFNDMPDLNIRELIRIYDKNAKTLQQKHSNPSLTVIGGLLVWGAGLFFAASAISDITKVSELSNPNTIMINSVIASSASAIGYLLMDIFLLENSNGGRKVLPEPMTAIKASLCGLFSIAAGCNSFTSTASVIVGIVSSIIYMLNGKVFKRFKIDDTCSSSVIHGI